MFCPSIFVIGLALSISNFDVALSRRYTILKSNFPLEEMKQVNENGSVFNVALTSTTENEEISDSKNGIRVIKIKRKPVINRKAKVQHHSKVEEDLIKENSNFQYTYFVPKEFGNTNRDKIRKYDNDDEYSLPKTDSNVKFHIPENISSLQKKKQEAISKLQQDYMKLQKISVLPSSEQQFKASGDVIGTSQKIIEEPTRFEIKLLTSGEEITYDLPNIQREEAFYQANPERLNENNKVSSHPDIFQEGYEYEEFISNLLHMEMPKTYGFVEDIIREYYFNPVILTSYDLLMHISHRLLWKMSHYPYFTISNDRDDDIPETFKVWRSLHQDEHVHYNNAKSEIILSEPVEFKPIRSDGAEESSKDLSLSEDQNEILEKFFLPKKEKGDVFYVPNKINIVPHEEYELPDVKIEANFAANCGENCYLSAKEYEFGVPILEDYEIKKPSSYEVPIY